MQTSSAQSNSINRQALILTFALSLVMLAYEILLNRIASVLLTSQYVFLILGLALLGISVGALLEFWRNAYAPGPRRQELVSGAITVAVMLVLAVLALIRFGDRTGIWLLSLAASLPFVASGFVFSRIFRLFTHRAGLLYGADLSGAAFAGLLAALLLPVLGPVRAIFLLALGLAALIMVLQWNRPKSRRFWITLGVTLAIAGIFGWMQQAPQRSRVPIGKNMDKDLHRLQMLTGDSLEIVDSRWSTFGRTDLVRAPGDTNFMTIFIDGAAGANMLRFNGDLSDTTTTFMGAVLTFGGMVPLLYLRPDQRNDALIIGPGGGRDVLIALRAGFENITAVEVNPEMVEIVKDYRDYNGGIYTDFPQVEVIIAEGRNYLRHQRKQYDLIMLYMPITKSSRDLNAFSLTENFLFTKEAFVDYFDRLTDEGRLLIMAHGMPEIFKMVTTALEALQEKGMRVEEGMQRLFVLGSSSMPLFGLQKQPVDELESYYLHAAAHYTIFDCPNSYIPGVEQQVLRLSLSQSIDAGIPMMNPMFMDLAKGKISLKRLETGTNVNLIPATDDSPFFFQYTFYPPPALSTLFWLSLGGLLLLVFVPGQYFRYNSYYDRKAFSWSLPLYFVAIGIGYIAVELAFFQKLIFHLGDPTKSLGLLLASLLLGSGVGSLLSENRTPSTAMVAGVATFLLSLVFWQITPKLFHILFDAPPMVQYGVAAAILFILGLPMGVMFPAGLRLIRDMLGPNGIPWAWAINGGASVLGSATAILYAMSSGYTHSLMFAAVSYLAAAVLIKIAHHVQSNMIYNMEVSSHA